jgi:hypothetical protein
VTEFLPLDTALDVPSECQWFALCVNSAEFLASHPVLDWVPVCAQHREWIEKLDEETKRRGVAS